LIEPLPPPWPAFVVQVPFEKVVVFAAKAAPAPPNDIVSANTAATINKVMRLRIRVSLLPSSLVRASSAKGLVLR